MTSRVSAKVTKALGPVALGRGHVKYAKGVQGGPWVFATGHLAQDYRSGLAASVEGRTASATPRYGRESALILKNIGETLAQAGHAFADSVRLDQFYTDAAAVIQHQRQRRIALEGHIPPSTSVLVNRLALPGAGIAMDLVSHRASDGASAEAFDRPDIAAAPSSGYAPALKAGNLVFVAGSTAEAQAGQPSHEGLAFDVLVHEGRQWQASPIILQASYVIEKKIVPALELAGCSLDQVVKAQIFLTHAEDVEVFRQVWADYFPSQRPATTIILCRPGSLAVMGARVEINVVAAPAETPVQRVDGEAGAFLPLAVRAGDLLFFSGMTADDDEEAPPLRDRRQPFFSSYPQAQAETILERAQTACRAMGTDLSNILKAQHFHADLGDFHAAHQAWRGMMPDLHVPFSAIEAAGTLSQPGNGLMLDLIVYAPTITDASV